jgi:hypothetical protein
MTIHEKPHRKSISAFWSSVITMLFVTTFLAHINVLGRLTRQEPAQSSCSQTAAAAATNPAQLNSEIKSEPARSTSGPVPLDVCALIEKSEIASVQGLPVQQIQATSQKHGDLDFAQCYYTAISADGSKNLSVYVQVIQRTAASVRRGAVKEFWKERFGRESKERESKEKRKEEQDEAEAIDPPVRVSGIGDEAFWLGSSRGGALFVLKRGKVLRVTVGGADAKAQIEKSKTLAEKALERLG